MDETAVQGSSASWRRIALALAFVPLSYSLTACGDNPVICTRGEVQPCACGAARGERTCNAQGTGWESCRSTLGCTCGTITGVRECNAEGIGWATCRCSSCGNGYCDYTLGEAPTNCPADCHDCLSCSPSGCPTGMACGRNACDGTRACVPQNVALRCDYIDNVAAPGPRVCNQRRCSPDTSDCGDHAVCTARPGGTGSICRLRCRIDADCTRPSESTATPACDTIAGLCVLRCSAASTCPDDLRCEPGSATGWVTCQ